MKSFKNIFKCIEKYNKGKYYKINVLTSGLFYVKYFILKKQFEKLKSCTDMKLSDSHKYSRDTNCSSQFSILYVILNISMSLIILFFILMRNNIKYLEGTICFL